MKFSIRRSVPAVSAALPFFGATYWASAAESGEAIYKEKCAVCHGADGSGQTGMGKRLKLRDLRSPVVQKMTDAQLSGIIAHGKPPMPSFQQSLGNEKIQAVVTYLRELAKKK